MKDIWTVTVGAPSGLREYLYGDDLSEFYTEEEMKDIKVIPYEKWTADDFAEILANEYEDANYHRFVGVPHIILRAIKAQGLGYDVQDALMRRICEKLYEEIQEEE